MLCENVLNQILTTMELMFPNTRMLKSLVHGESLTLTSNKYLIRVSIINHTSIKVLVVYKKEREYRPFTETTTKKTRIYNLTDMDTAIEEFFIAVKEELKDEMEVTTNGNS